MKPPIQPKGSPWFDNAEDSIDADLAELEKAKSKVIMDFGLDRPQPERVTIEILKQLIKERPEKMCHAVRQWLHSDRA